MEKKIFTSLQVFVGLVLVYGDFGTTMSKALNPDPNFVFGNVVAKCYDMFGKLHHIKTILGLISDLDIRCPVFGCSLPFLFEA